MLSSKLITNSLEKYASEALHAEDTSSFLKYLIMYLEFLHSDDAFYAEVQRRLRRLPTGENEEEFISTDSLPLHFMKLEEYYLLVIKKKPFTPTIDGYYDDLTERARD